MNENNAKKSVILFIAAISLIALANGLSGSLFSNYFKEVYNITALQRGALETPRESSGILCIILFAGLGFMGDVSLGFLAQILTLIGIAVMAFFNPSYSMMIPFLFLFSTGQHLFMPVNDSIALSLAEEGHSGSSLGRFKKYSNFFAMLAGAAVFIGFRFNIFSFSSKIILPFAIAAILYAASAVILYIMNSRLPHKKIKNSRFVLRKDYLPYYLTTFAFGCQKRIRIVFGPWIIIELLAQGADVIAILTLISNFVSSITAPAFGRFLDRHGVKISMKFEAAYMAVLFVLEGVLAGGLALGKFHGVIFFILAYCVFVLNFLTTQFQMVHSCLIKQLAAEHPEEITASLSMGVSVDHIMAITISPVLGYIWVAAGPAWVFFTAAVSVLVQLAVSTWMLPDKA